MRGWRAPQPPGARGAAQPWKAVLGAARRSTVRLAVRPIKRARPNRQVHPNKQCANIGRFARYRADYAVRTAVLVSGIFLMAVSARGASLAQENEQHGGIEVGVVLDTARQAGR